MTVAGATILSEAELRLEQLAGRLRDAAASLDHDDLCWACTQAERSTHEPTRLRAAQLLAQSFQKFAHEERDLARRVHRVLLHDLMAGRKNLSHPSCSWLVGSYLRDESLPHIPWGNATEVAAAAECFYGVCDK